VRPSSKIRRSLNAASATLFAGGVLFLAGKGMSPLPPLGPAFNPGTGVWTIAKDAQLPGNQTLHLPFLQQPVTVLFDKQGVAYINAQTNHDLFATLGYLHASFRLTQMDLMRRQGEGRLAEVVGKKALESDKFELQLGLLRTAQQEWRQMAKDSPACQALTAYAEGVNAKIEADKQSGSLPFMFKMLGYQPEPWTPVDSLVIQGIMTQTLDFNDKPLDYALLVKSLGYERTMEWFPVLPPNEQHPYDPGPYKAGGIAPIDSAQEPSQALWNAAIDVKQRLRQLPPFAIHHGSNSNNWAVDGTKTANGKPLTAGDPHLSQTLPAIWYQVQADAPDYHFAGVSIPGVPIILIGHNEHISWSLTNVQNQATFYYAEKTDADHPGQYYWKGAWRPFQRIEYDIPVKGARTEHLVVNLTVHGPVLTQKGQTLAVDWMGARPSPDLEVLLNVIRAKNFTEFRNALRDWHAPSQNFVYADENGNIGLISAGYYPIIRKGDPWLPLPGTGESDIVGTIPFDSIPQVYNPPWHFVFSANQRVVGNDYPYYIGTSFNFFDNGYRANVIYHALRDGKNFTVDDMKALQLDTRDYLASLIVPRLLDSLARENLSGQAATAYSLLQKWDYRMEADSPAASIWWTFLNKYLENTFGPWWQHFKVPVDKDQDIAISPNRTSLVEDLEAWTLHDPNNPAFSLPDGTKRTAEDVMRKSFLDAVQSLQTQLGADPHAWVWGRLHSRQFPSLLKIPELGYGPYPSGGNIWTVNAADSDDGYLSTAGPSWRFIMDWGTKQGIGVYPGGQSENPMSPWYSNLIPAWWNGVYYPMQDFLATKSTPEHITWTMTPDKSR
jgi:penicillin amidase